MGNSNQASTSADPGTAPKTDSKDASKADFHTVEASDTGFLSKAEAWASNNKVLVLGGLAGGVLILVLVLAASNPQAPSGNLQNLATTVLL